MNTGKDMDNGNADADDDASGVEGELGDGFVNANRRLTSLLRRGASLRDVVMYYYYYYMYYY